ncbi:uncharacterized protein [Palaemon carinicauda]|uniref:uncharacterized protein n=1 Tax=Palaemon carinicauda TaxID=392227 RepID=UPI0035B64B75
MKRNLLNQLMAMTLLVSIYALFNVVIHTSWLLKDYPVFDNDIHYLESPPPVSFGYLDFSVKLEEEESHLMPSKARPPKPGMTTEETVKEKTNGLRVGGEEIKSPNEKSTEQLKILLDAITKPTYFCSKMLNQGGRTCKLVPDGDKKVCMDEGIGPKRDSCIVYSIGIGHDFSYDFFMTKYGCNVFSMDHDYLHSFYDTNRMYKRLYMASVRLGTMIEYRTVHDNIENSTFTYFYRPLDNIMYILHHENANLDVLKIDIEGDEFHVFEDSIFKTDILERTRQLSIEIHLEKFLVKNATEDIEALARNYTRFFVGLKSHGFELAYYEPNIITPVPLVKVLGINFPVCFEQLWVNRNVRPGEMPVYEKPIRHYVKQLEPKDKHLIQSQ